MIFRDGFEAVKTIVEACVFIGASLSVNGYDQGEIEHVTAQRSDIYYLNVSGVFWAEILYYECGTNNEKNFVRINASMDYFQVPGSGQTVSTLQIDSTAPTDLCGNQKGIFCP